MTAEIRLQAGQSLQLHNRRWHLRQARSIDAHHLELEFIGASAASLGLTRRLKAVRYGNELFISRGRQPGYWYGHLGRDWLDTDSGPVLNCTPATPLDLLAAHTRHPSAGDLKNEFSWSYSRAAKFRQCPRAYYYHYYAAWEGWRSDAAEPVRRTYLLKNLTNLSRWVGDLVHQSIKFALTRLQAGQPITPADLVKQMHRRARADFEDSRRGRYRQQPNRFIGFQEHYYRLELPGSTWQSAWSRAEQYLQTFLHSNLYAHLACQLPATFLQIEELVSFNLAGVKVWLQPDLIRREEETQVLYDWKTGEIDEAELRRQLAIYALYVRQRWPDQPVRGIVFDLAHNRLLEYELADTELPATQAQIEASAARLQHLLLDPAANLAELRRFPMIDDLSTCRQCQFRELCGR